MTQKKKDEHNRLRDIIVNFRMSPKERVQLDKRIELSGRRKQDYMIQSALCQQLIVLGNKSLYLKLKERLDEIETQLHRIEKQEDVDPIVLYELRVIFEIAAGWKS